MLTELHKCGRHVLEIQKQRKKDRQLDTFKWLDTIVFRGSGGAKEVDGQKDLEDWTTVGIDEQSGCLDKATRMVPKVKKNSMLLFPPLGLSLGQGFRAQMYVAKCKQN